MVLMTYKYRHLNAPKKLYIKGIKIVLTFLQKISPRPSRLRVVLTFPKRGMVRQAHHDICHPEPVEGWQMEGRRDFLIVSNPCYKTLNNNITIKSIGICKIQRITKFKRNLLYFFNIRRELWCKLLWRYWLIARMSRERAN